MIGTFLTPKRRAIVAGLYGVHAPAVERFLSSYSAPTEVHDPVLNEFFTNTKAPRRAALDWLLCQGVTTSALAQDADGLGATIGEAHVLLDERGGFDFAPPDTIGAQRALIAIARDRCGAPLDLIGWQPKSDRVASYFNRAIVLGEHELDASRDEPLKVHKDFLTWLRHDRAGVLIVDARRAWRLLHEEEISAGDVAHGLALRKMLRPPSPKIVVPERATQVAA